jgi:glycosyltransferase involved in cell wall biosynthesis
VSRAAVVIPALDEEATIAAVVEAVRDVAQPIVVDDGSTDATAERAARAGAVVVTHAAPRGYDGALRSGITRARQDGYDAVATIDADGQHPPALLRQLLGPVLDGEADLVLGLRATGARASERAFSAYTRARFGVPDILCGMKAYSAPVLDECGSWFDRPTIGTGTALCALRRGFRHATVDVPIRERQGGRPRFGSGVRANARILRAFAMAAAADVRATATRRRASRRAARA